MQCERAPRCESQRQPTAFSQSNYIKNCYSLLRLQLIATFSQGLPLLHLLSSYTVHQNVSDSLKNNRKQATVVAGSARFGGNAGMATFVERAGDAALELGPPPPLGNVPGRLRYGWRLWQVCKRVFGAIAASSQAVLLGDCPLFDKVLSKLL